MLVNRTIRRLEEMLDAAMNGDFEEKEYDETKLSRLETKWKRFLNASVLSKEALAQERETLKSLISDISHQTKTPMTNIKLYTSLLDECLRGEDNREQKEKSIRLVEELVHQTEKLEFLIHALTKMSRLEGNIVEVKPKQQSVYPLLVAVREENLLKAERKNIAIKLECPEESTACFDYKWTGEAVGNVLDNAIKYTEEGTLITMKVMVFEMYLAIMIKDQGMGIREEDIPGIFNRFYRSKEVSEKEGVGIGLYLTREILRKENGYVKVRSVPGEGSEFALYLPRCGK